MARRVAFVTGASRGIGRAASIALARRGYDVVVTARTLAEGDGIVRGASADDPREIPVAGSVEATAQAVRDEGQQALPIRLDLLDLGSIEAAVETALREWGRIDLLLNNGIYQGPGLMDRFMDLPLDAMETVFVGNVFNQVRLTRLILPHMLERGAGVVIDMTSNAGQNDPPRPTGEGGWGFAYGASKGAFHRMAGILHVEHRKDGIRAYNVDPGYTRTETMRALMGDDHAIERTFAGAPPEVTGEVIAWIASDPLAEQLSGRTIQSHVLCAERGLLPDWPPQK
jgi:NAD(P)-dependent dehydrogenase (short-subunit alcohol dehydrogenase family)